MSRDVFPFDGLLDRLLLILIPRDCVCYLCCNCCEYLQIDPEGVKWAAILFCNRAAAFIAMKDFTEAIADCHHAIEKDAGHSRAFLRRARAHSVRHYLVACIRVTVVLCCSVLCCSVLYCVVVVVFEVGGGFCV